MKTRKVFSTLMAVMFVAAYVLLAADVTNGQGRYANRYSKRDVSQIISRLESSSDQFRRDFDRQMDRSNINGTASEDQFNNIVADFENSVDQLRREFDRNSTWWDSRYDVEDMLRDARPVNQMMNNLPFRRNLERRWNRLRDDINKVADTYDLNGLNGGGWNGGSGDWGNSGGNVPSWAVGTFYGRNPETGGSIALTVSNDGSVSISLDGKTPVYASMRGRTLTNGPYVSRVTQINNGIRTTDTTNGNYIEYYRNQGGGGDWNGGGGGGNVPSWAVGTFYGRNPETGGTIVLTIAGNGNVTISADGAAAVYASMNNTTLTNGPYVSRVTRINNGIRTTDVNNGRYIDYFRR